MRQTGVVINRESWLLLMDEPLYSIRFIDREGTAELAVVTRVEDLELFLEASLPLTLALTTWQSPEKTGVVAIGYQLHPTWGASRGGVFYLNPCQASESTILHKLVQQDNLALIFLNKDCSLHYTTALPLAPRQLEKWRKSLAVLNQESEGSLLDSQEDADAEFATALHMFQEQHSLEDILTGRSRT